jgi:hypothetical protein
MRTLIQKNDLDWPTRRLFALEVAQGMAHLHLLGSMRTCFPRWTRPDTLHRVLSPTMFRNVRCSHTMVRRL